MKKIKMKKMKKMKMKMKKNKFINEVMKVNFQS